MHPQDAVVKLCRYFFLLDPVGDAERAFPVPPNPLVPPKLIVGNSSRRGAFPSERQNAATEAQLQVRRDGSRKLGRQQILVVELVEIDRRKRPIEARERKGETLEQAVDLALEVAQRI